MDASREENYISTDNLSILFNPKINLGQGRYGTVYPAKFFGAECVAKKLHFTEGKVNDESLAAFTKEMEIIKKLKHPNIVDLLEVCCRKEDNPNLPILIMSKMSMPLNKFLEWNPSMASLYQKVCILYDITCGLLYLHNQNVIHRDLTVKAIFLTEELSAKIADFGQARDFSKQKSNILTRVPGELSHMPPEAHGNKPNYTSKIDIFSFGCVVIQMITNETPKPCTETKQETSDGKYVTMPEIKRREKHIKKITDLGLVELYEIVKVCLENDPQDRPMASNLLKLIEKYKEVLHRSKEGNFKRELGKVS